jgi:hypothetical protein
LARADDDRTIYVGGTADAVAYQPRGVIDLEIDWKTDVSPTVQQITLYREQMRDYLVAQALPNGSSSSSATGQLVRVQPNFLLPSAAANAA